MSRIRTLAILLAAVCSLAPAPFRPRTRSYRLDGLPPRDYQHGQVSRKVEALSLTKIEFVERRAFDAGKAPPGWQVLPAPVLRDRVRFYQLNRPSLQVDHCFISRVVFLLDEDGHWTLSLQADQNPARPEPGQGPVATETPKKVTTHILRNQFCVAIRCLGAADAPQEKTLLTVPRPVFFRVEPEPFWVQRQAPYDFLAHGQLDDVRRFFDLIDRVEIEFHYR